MKSQDFKSFLNKMEQPKQVKEQIKNVEASLQKTIQTESVPSELNAQLSYIIEQIGFIKSQLSNLSVPSQNYNPQPSNFKENQNPQNYIPRPNIQPTAFSTPQTNISASMSGEPVDIMAHAGSILA